MYFHTGCGQCWTMDGNWKLMFPHCMYPVKVTIPGLPGLTHPDICENQPGSSKEAFCKKHLDLAKEKDVPTDVKGFIQYCGGSAKFG